MFGYEYPTTPHARRHGPEGYKNTESFRDWLRDEFHFRCVYCLHRERWDSRSMVFHIEHLVPVSEDEALRYEYANLLYSCATCNNAKSAILGVPDPCGVAFGKCIHINDKAEVEALNEEGEALVRKLKLNTKSSVEHRKRWMRNLITLKESNPELFDEYMGFPNNLPDLLSKQVPRNSKPEGADNCYFEQRKSGKLPKIY